MKKEDFCAWIKSLRQKVITRKALAKKCRYHESTLKSYELNRLPDIDYLHLLSKVTGVSLALLIQKRLSVHDASQGDSPSNGPIFSAQELALLEGVAQPEGTDTETFTMSDDSMTPTIQRSAACEVDVHDHELSPGKVYMFKVGEQVTARRVQQSLSGERLLVADNATYAAQVLTNELLGQLHTLGRVLVVRNLL